MTKSRILVAVMAMMAFFRLGGLPCATAKMPGTYSLTWVGNSLSGANNKWVQNFFVDTEVQPDGTVNT